MHGEVEGGVIDGAKDPAKDAGVSDIPLRIIGLWVGGGAINVRAKAELAAHGIEEQCPLGVVGRAHLQRHWDIELDGNGSVGVHKECWWWYGVREHQAIEGTCSAISHCRQGAIPHYRHGTDVGCGGRHSLPVVLRSGKGVAPLGGECTAGRGRLLGILASRKNLQAHGYHCSFHLRVFQGLSNPMECEYDIYGSGTSKDTTPVGSRGGEDYSDSR